MSPAPDSSKATRLLLGLALLATLFGCVQVLWSAWQQDWTYDEPYHMQWARRLWVERVSERKSDPLWNSKTPVMLAHVAAKQAGRALGVREGRPASFCARLPSALCYLAVLGTAFAFARRRFGPAVAALAVVALALDPSLIANSAVATVDAPYTLATLFTLVAGVRLFEAPSATRALVLGLALGLAFATKFTAFLLIPGLLLLPLCYGVQALRGRGRALAYTLLVGIAALLAVDVAYLFVDFARPLGLIAWKSGLMTRVAEALPHLRLPVPADFLTGLDICLAHERGRAWSVLILDRRYPDGVWWYFLVSYALKTPLLLLAGELVGLVRLLRARLQPGERPVLLFLGLNLALSLVYFSCLFRAQIGYRYVLMCLPFVALLAARGLVETAPGQLSRGALVVAAAAAFELAPYSGNALAFTSPLVQPKRQAFRFLTNSSIDWGQNDEQVTAWIERQRERRPGETLLWEPTHIRPGVNVLGLNSLAGGGSYNQHRWLREHRQPEGHFRHTYVWFTIDAATYERFLNEDRRLDSRPEDASACAPGPELAPLALDTWRAFPENPQGSNAWIVCAHAPQGADLALVGTNVGLLLGRAGAEMRDWDRLRGGEELVYRLEPGWHALAAIKAQLFVGRFELRRGTADLSYRPAILRKKGRFELWSSAAKTVAPTENESP